MNSSPPRRAIASRTRYPGAKQQVAVAQASTQAVTERFQEPIAGVVAIAVVDQLELIEIDEQHGEPPVLPGGVDDGLAQHLLEVQAVRQISHGIEVGEFALPDVLRHADDRAAISHPGGRQEHRDATAVAMPVGDFHRSEPRPLLEARQHFAAHLFLLAEEQIERSLQEVAFGIAEEPAIRLVHGSDVALGREDHQRFGHRVEDAVHIIP